MRKKTGELELFREIWKGSDETSFVSGRRIYNPGPSNFHHVLTKGAYPRFRLYKKNIVLLTTEEHNKIHTWSRYKLLKESLDWEKIFNLELKLKMEYFQDKYTP